jgi:uncharacterized protein Yka (UPF0111/DUF47 family)
MIKYTVDKSGVVELIHSVDDTVDSLLKEKYIIDLFEGDIDAAREEIRFLAVETQAQFEYIENYFKTLHKKSRKNT